MLWTSLLVVSALLSPQPASVAASVDAMAIRHAIVKAVQERVAAVDVEVELLEIPTTLALPVAARPLAGARFGHPSRFVLTPATGTRVTVLAKVDAVGLRAIARTSIPRSASLSMSTVELTEGSLEGVAIAASPALVTTAQGLARRAIAAGEILTTALVRLPYAVRAGDRISLVFRHAGIEARGAGTAVNSGAVGDVVRVLAPGKRQPLRARIVAPAVVEILQ